MCISQQLTFLTAESHRFLVRILSISLSHMSRASLSQYDRCIQNPQYRDFFLTLLAFFGIERMAVYYLFTLVLV